MSTNKLTIKKIELIIKDSIASLDIKNENIDSHNVTELLNTYFLLYNSIQEVNVNSVSINKIKAIQKEYNLYSIMLDKILSPIYEDNLSHNDSDTKIKLSAILLDQIRTFLDNKDPWIAIIELKNKHIDIDEENDLDIEKEHNNKDFDEDSMTYHSNYYNND